ncbi:MAG TPA: NAD(+)/NADH kinase [Spirochaetota bacterium]|nr:NAD(+)/NADH kinase [Spirochaetota bacterium]
MICLITNKNKRSDKLIETICRFLKKQKYEYKIIDAYPFQKKDKKNANRAELLIIIGGDGTILTALSQFDFQKEVKIIPIHFGRLGFISSIPSARALALIKNYLNNNRRQFKNETRPLLEITTGDKTYYALNEAVITKKKPGRLISLEAYFSKFKAVSFRADGVILATATGSTAYNLSADGPILHPQVEAVVFNPVCPHSLTLKPLVIPGHAQTTIKISPDNTQTPEMILDGNISVSLKPGQSVHSSLCSKKITFIKPAGENFYATIKTKLHWGKDNTFNKIKF